MSRRRRQTPTVSFGHAENQLFPSCATRSEPERGRDVQHQVTGKRPWSDRQRPVGQDKHAVLIFRFPPHFDNFSTKKRRLLKSMTKLTMCRCCGIVYTILQPSLLQQRCVSPPLVASVCMASSKTVHPSVKPRDYIRESQPRTTCGHLVRKNFC